MEGTDRKKTEQQREVTAASCMRHTVMYGQWRTGAPALPALTPPILHLNQPKESPICIEHTRCLFVFAVLLNRFCTGRQAKELFNYWQKPTQTRLKKGEKRAKTRESRFSLFFFLHFFFSCCGTRALHVLWRRFLCMEENRITCFFAAHTYLCAGKAMHWFSLCVQMIQGAMNPLCRDA